MEAADVPGVVGLWNDCFVHDRVDPDGFRRVVLDDPNHEQGGSLVAVDKDGIAGFVSCIVRQGTAGKDGMGRGSEKDQGYLKAICGRESNKRKQVLEALLARAIDFMSSRGKKRIKVVEYTGRYFFPGIDLRYTDTLNVLERNGFEQIHELQDVMADLADYEPTPYQLNAEKRCSENGVTLAPYEPAMLDNMRRLVDKINMPQWFPEGWESRWRDRSNAFVAFHQGEIVGYACYHPSDRIGGFGTTAVLPEMRGNGIGSCLLVASMLRMKELGTPKVIAGWANTPFYVRNGWKICRRYAVLQRDIG